ncbi:MAG: DUF3306 domain-containing protein [Betaproteobacteria bacterium]
MGRGELPAAGKEAAHPAKIIREQGWPLQGRDVMSSSDKPAVKPDDASFLSRWSRRKTEAKAEPAHDAEMQKTSMGAVPGAKVPETPHPEPTLPVEPQARQELPDIATLTHEDDFLPFMAKDIDPGLRNEAMRKLFTDPHYQFAQMDKLDIYIDDYSKPDPIPLEMLRKMNQAKRLFLFDDDENDAAQQSIDTRAEVPTGAAPAAGDVSTKGSGTVAGEGVEGTIIDKRKAPEKFTGMVVEPDHGDGAGAVPPELARSKNCP